MLVALKASWTVTAGIIPGVPIHEYTRMWSYTSEDAERDILDNPAVTRYSKQRDAAEAYLRQLTDPQSVNWTRLDWMWF